MQDHAPAAADAVPFQITDDIVDVFLGGVLLAGSRMATTATPAAS
jgi:hypothetical protein